MDWNLSMGISIRFTKANQHVNMSTCQRVMDCLYIYILRVRSNYTHRDYIYIFIIFASFFSQNIISWSYHISYWSSVKYLHAPKKMQKAFGHQKAVVFWSSPRSPRRCPTRAASWRISQRWKRSPRWRSCAPTRQAPRPRNVPWDHMDQWMRSHDIFFWELY